MRRLLHALTALAFSTGFVVASPAPASSAPRVAAPPAAAAAPCRTSYAPPRADRPVVDLRFDLSTDRRRFNGLEHIEFRPNLPTNKIVLRQWVNMPALTVDGGHGRISRVVVSGATTGVFTPPDNGSTILTLTLRRTLRAGERVVLDIRFHVRLPDGGDRSGSNGRTSWWASAHPMLAWEHGVGWATEGPGTLWGERTTSEDFHLRRLQVRTGLSDGVLTSARHLSRRRISASRMEHLFSATSVRDAMVAVGTFRLDRRTASGVRLAVGVAPGVSDDPHRVANEMARSIAAHSARFGPFPYADLTVVVLPRVGGGIEFPGGIMLGSGEFLDATGSHEVAHEYFYGLVGNNQGRDPWLDESFATYAEALDRGTGGAYLGMTVPADARNRVGAPMAYWERHQTSYFRGVYIQGAAALLRARAASGAARFDAAMRCYVRATARRVARPADLADALAALPEARAILVRAGALPARFAP